MLDPELGWTTLRLRLEPLDAQVAAELFGVLDDPGLRTFIGGEPLSLTALTERYVRLAERRSPDGTEVWANWVIRRRGDGRAVGTLQATVPAAGPCGGAAELGWVVGRPWQGQGLATEAATALADRLAGAGWVVMAHIHPDHLASQRVASAAGMQPTALEQDGEIRWVRLPAGGDAGTPVS